MTRDERVYRIMKSLQMSSSYKGYRYLKTAIMMILDDETVLQSFVKRIYAKIAETCDDTASNVERNMRHVIRKSYCKPNDEICMKIFGTIETKTNKEFIAEICEYIKQLEKIEKANNLS